MSGNASTQPGASSLSGGGNSELILQAFRRHLQDHPEGLFTEANRLAGTADGLPPNSPTFNQFVNFVRPTVMNYQFNFQLNVPTPLSIEPNAIPSTTQLKDKLLAMDEGIDHNGKKQESMSALPAYGEPAKTKFRNVVHLSPNQLKNQLKTLEQLLEYIYYFAHPAVCHSRVHLGKALMMIQNQGSLIGSQQEFLKTLYSDLSNSFASMNLHLQDITKNQNQTTQWIQLIEEELPGFVTRNIEEFLAFKGLDNNWIGAVTHHVKGAEAMLRYLTEEMLKTQQAVVSLERSHASSTQNHMFEKDITELSELIKVLKEDMDLKMQTMSRLGSSVASLTSQVQENIRNIDFNHTDFNQLREHVQLKDRSMKSQVNALQNQVDTMDLELKTCHSEISNLSAIVQNQQESIGTLQMQLARLTTRMDASTFMDNRSSHSVRRSTDMSKKSTRSTGGNASYHSYDSDEDNIGRTGRNVHVLQHKDEEDMEDEPPRSARDARQEASEARFRASTARFNSPPPRRNNPEPSPGIQFNFKPANLPKFDKKTNVYMFLQLYENSMYGADLPMKNSSIINCLDSEVQTLILPRLPTRSWTFDNVSKALIEEYGSEEALFCRKMEFTEGKINKGETLVDFSARFYLEAQTLISMGAATFVDVKGALLNYVRPNRDLSIALKSGIYGSRTVPDLIRHLGAFKEQFEIPFPETKKTSTYDSKAPSDNKPSSILKNTTSSSSAPPLRVCFRCNKPGHMSRDCKLPKQVRLVELGEDSEEDLEEVVEDNSSDRDPKNC